MSNLLSMVFMGSPGSGTSLDTPLPVPGFRQAGLAAVPDGLLGDRLPPARPLAHVGVPEVDVRHDAVPITQAEEGAHVAVVGDRPSAPDGPEAQRVGGKEHVLDGGRAGSVVLLRLDLVAPGARDHGNNRRRAEGLLALAADPAGRHLLALALLLGLQPGRLRAGAGQLPPALAGKDVEEPGLRDLVVRRVHRALEDGLYLLVGHRVLLYAVHALARPHGIC